MKIKRLLILHARCIKLIKFTLQLEKANEQWRHFADEIVDENYINFGQINKELDRNNKKIQKAWILYKQVDNEIKETRIN